MNEHVSIIILNYNGRRFLKECIESVLSQSYTAFEIIFFDNGSTDGSAEYAVKYFTDSRLKVIKNPLNLGFAGGNNEALKHCSNNLIVLLNNDTKVHTDWLKHLAGAMEEKNTIASSFVITEGIPEKYYDSNGSVSYLMYNIMNVFPNTEDEFYPNGCSVIFRRSEIGKPFDGDYFYYGEDVYLGLKARFTGMKIKFVKDSIVHHFGSGSTAGASEKKSFYSERNRFLNLYIFFSIGFIIKMIPYIALNHTSKIILSLFSQKLSFTGVLKAFLWFYANIHTVVKKRREIKQHLKADEKNVLAYISCKIFNGESLPGKTVNMISYIYSRVLGIKPVEYFLKNKLPLP